MRPTGLLIAGVIAPVIVVAALVARGGFGMTWNWSATEPGFDATAQGEDEEAFIGPTEPPDPYANWVRPEGPPKVALQAGHWKSSEVPDELENLKGNGARAAGVSEWETNLAIAQAAAKMLQDAGVPTEVLPTTVPPAYWADVFVSIHADGSPNTLVSGYKAAAPRRDRTGKAQALADRLEAAYGEATDMVRDPNVTRNMRGYYAFNWRRYEHALHPMTTAVILETGFLTNANDRKIIVRAPQVSARAVADAVLEHLRAEGLLTDAKDAGSVDSAASSQ